MGTTGQTSVDDDVGGPSLPVAREARDRVRLAVRPKLARRYRVV